MTKTFTRIALAVLVILHWVFFVVLGAYLTLPYTEEACANIVAQEMEISFRNGYIQGKRDEQGN